jgi:cardiolipin synthase
MLMTIDLPLLLGAAVVCMHILGALAACHAVLHTRTSQGAVAWAVSLVAAPYLTLVPYLFLGRSKFAGYVDARRMGNRRMRNLTSKLDRGSLKAALEIPSRLIGQRATQALIGLAGTPFVAGNRVSLLINGAATFEAIFAALEQAREYIIVQFFIIRDDALGRRLSDALIAKAQAGVRVYFLFDGIGCHDLPNTYTERLRQYGVEAHAFSTTRYFVNRFQLNFRNHRKIVIVDGCTAFIGGHNVSVQYLGLVPPLAPWRDTHIKVEGPAVGPIQIAFIEDWYWATGELPQIEWPQTVQADGTNMHCQVIASGPADEQETCSLFFVTFINAAQQRVWITTPYFIPDEAVFAALRLAVLRGVDVRILIPSRRDHYVVFMASTLYAYDAVRAGVQMFRYQPGFIHQKVLLIDDVAASIGSANLDNRSFRLNFEITVLTVDKDFAAQVEEMLTEDFMHATPIERGGYRRTAYWKRFAMHLARLFAPIL